VNTEHLPGQLDIEDAIHGARSQIEDVPPTTPPGLVMSVPQFQKFTKACWCNPEMQRRLWPHLAPSRLPSNRAERRKAIYRAREEYKRLGHDFLAAEVTA
jgi:hypothetical protein